MADNLSLEVNKVPHQSTGLDVNVRGLKREKLTALRYRVWMIKHGRFVTHEEEH